MDLFQAMQDRHSVRSYQDRPIEGETKEKLQSFLAQCSRESGLHLQLVLNEPGAFSGLMARYGNLLFPLLHIVQKGLPDVFAEVDYDLLSAFSVNSDTAVFKINVIHIQSHTFRYADSCAQH